MPIMSAISKLPEQLLSRSGSIFYSSSSAFRSQQPLYLLGLNPGGSPVEMATNTIKKQFAAWRTIEHSWSAYVDESWQNKPAGTHGMQPRIRHLFDSLGVELRDVPASNVVFARTSNEAALKAEKAILLQQCWPVHEAVINHLGVKTILCLGDTAGRWVREAIGADQLIGTFTEQNNRRWTSAAHMASDGRAVVTLTHPGRADWKNPAADPTPLVRNVLAR